MKPLTKSLALCAVAAACAALAEPALARQNRGGGGRARAVVVADEATAGATARLSIDVREKGRGRTDFRMTLQRAADSLAPEAFVADASGALVLAGALVQNPRLPSEYRLRLRDALPGGAATIADLPGRAFEVRNGADVLAAGTLPEVGARVRPAGGAGGGADDGTADPGRGRGTDDAAGAETEHGPEHEAAEHGPETETETEAETGTQGRGRGGRGR